LIFGKHINRYYIKYGWRLLFGLAALILVDYCQLIIPELYRTVINGINGIVTPFDMDVLLDDICKPLLIIIAMMVIGRFAWRFGFFGSAIKVERDIRDRMFDHCKDLSQQYYQVNKVGNLMSLFTNDLETINDCFGDGLLMACDALIMGSLAFVKMFKMNPLLTAFSIIPMVFLFLAANKVGKLESEKWDARQARFSDLSDFSQESFTGIAVIKAFAKEVKELQAIKKIIKANEDINVEYVKISTFFDIMISLFAETVIVIVLGYGGYLVYTGVFNAGELVEFISYFTSIIWPILAISFLIDMGARGKASLNRVSELLDAPVDVKDTDEVTEFSPEIRGGIEFRHLSFQYPGSPLPILNDISFTINPGENVGLIGKTGCGKTTLVDLIARTYNVEDGTLFVDGIDVNTIPIAELRSHIAYVPQDNFLFSTEIEDNIAFAFPTGQIDEEAVAFAAKMADVAENISEFPDKYKTKLGERGVTVSGGQKQRISIARALMKNAEILILDDSVSAVDTKTERTILENLRATRTGKTTILIAHRITTIEHMDKIIFIDEGKVMDVGTHAELQARCPAYAQMVELQRLEDEKEAKGLINRRKEKDVPAPYVAEESGEEDF